MSYHRSVHPSTQTAVPSQGGCLAGFLIPPLAVLVVGSLLALLSLGSPLASSVSASPSLPDEEMQGVVTELHENLPVENAPISIQASHYQTQLSNPAAGRSLAGLAPLFTPEVHYWAAEIQIWAAEAGLDQNLVATVMQIESCGNPLARSSAGAMGLFQVMHFHFYETDNPYDPDTNAVRGMAYLKRSLDTAGGDFRLALAGYNGGISVISRAESTWAAETQRYVYWGSGIYQDAVTTNDTNGANESPRLQEWLEAGGISLCKQARPRLGMGD
ncbi:MAG: transglycosylase SLT domain-containing protein [Chloroflexi bacterium]|nr:transglycosylase SLT domain-containing protein [Chloroflexota bacterium]